MNDTTNTLTLEGLSLMGGNAVRVGGDRDNPGATRVEHLPVAPSQVGYSGGVEPTTVPAMTAHEAAEEHTKLASQMAAIDEKLAAQRFDTNTGKPTGFQTEGRERELLSLQKLTLQNAIDYLGHRAREQLPRRGDAQAASDQALLDGAERERQISALAETRDSFGKELGRITATRMIDEARARAKADALARGGR